MTRLVFIIFLLIFTNTGGFAQEMGDKEDIKMEAKQEKKVNKKDKKVSVFEIVNKLLKVDVTTEGKRFSKEQKAEISGKIESSIKDCIAKVLVEKEEFQKRDKKLFDADSVLKVKVVGGTFENIKVQNLKTKSPFMKECINSLKEFETGYNINSELVIRVKTRIK